MSSVQKISFRSQDKFFNKNNQQYLQSTTLPISTTQPANNAGTQQPSVIYVQTENKSNNDKLLSCVSAATALVSLGVAGAVVAKSLSNGKFTKQNAEAMINPLKDSLGRYSEDLNRLGNKLNDAQQQLSEKISGLGKWQDGKIEDLRSCLHSQDDRISALGTQQEGIVSGLKNEFNEQLNGIARLASESHAGFHTCDVKVNGMPLRLANVYSEIYGEPAKALEKELQTESAKRILGVIDRSNQTPKDFVWVRMPTSEVRPFSNTGGMSIVPKEFIANLAGLLNTKQKAGLILDTPMYTGNMKNGVFYEKVVNYDAENKADGTFSYMQRFFDKEKKEWKYENILGKDANGQNLKLKEIDELNIPIYTDKSKNIENVKLYMTDGLRSQIEYESLAERLEPEILSDIEKTISEGKDWENELIRIYKNPDSGKLVAEAKYKAVLYDSPKFNLDGRTNENFNIYRNDALESGETERFVYFSKFFTEHLMGAESSKVKLGADLIVGNDWQTGPISAILRQLTTVKKYYGMDPVKADHLHNIPIVTIMHNAGLSGNVWHSQSKLLNIMFGEHATKVVTNSYMPNVSIDGKGGLPGTLMNGMFSGNCLNPQTMAASYSDILVPVSKHYNTEMASHSYFGGDNHDIFKIRARMFEFGDMENIKKIANQNGLDEKLINEKPTMIGVTNGCDPSNNILSKNVARKIEEALNLKNESLWTLKAGEDVGKWHRHNKGVYLQKVIEDLNTAKASGGKNNPMNIELLDLTDLSGVTVDTPVYSTAGRIVDQKGLDIFAESIKEFYKDFKGSEYPMFYVQGVGDRKFIEAFLNVKKELSKTHPEAAKRLVYAGLFSEPGRYDGCKLMSDFTIMSSWFEPCGLVHKEIAKFSGAIPIVLEVGGLTDGLTNKVNSLFAKFVPRYESEALYKNAKSLAAAMQEGYAWFKDTAKFSKGLEASQKANHGWLSKNGPIEQYGKIFVDLNVFSPKILQTAEKNA